MLLFVCFGGKSHLQEGSEDMGHVNGRGREQIAEKLFSARFHWYDNRNVSSIGEFNFHNVPKEQALNKPHPILDASMGEMKIEIGQICTQICGTGFG